MGNMTTSGAAVRLAGLNVSTAIPEEAYTEWISGAECFINVATRNNWSDSFATLSDDVKFILGDTAASLAAIEIIKYDMSGYTSRYEAETMLDVLRDKITRAISFLRDKKQEDFMNDA